MRRARVLHSDRFVIAYVTARHCQYCGARHERLTKDHVMPRWAMRTLWRNTAYACTNCNARKGGRSPGAWLFSELRDAHTEPETMRVQAMIARVSTWMTREEMCEAACAEWLMYMPHVY